MIKAKFTSIFQMVRDTRSVSPTPPATIITHNAKSAVRRKCEHCGRIILERPGYEGSECVAKSTKSVEWPDSINNFELVLSCNVVRDLYEIQASGFIAHEIPVLLERGSVDKTIPIKTFYIIEVKGGIHIDREQFDQGDGILCPGCHIWEPRPSGKVRHGDKATVPILESWDGSDFVVIRNIRYGGVYCSTRIVELARKQQWTGIGFSSILPRVPLVNLSNPDWLSEIEGLVKEKYPFL